MSRLSGWNSPTFTRPSIWLFVHWSPSFSLSLSLSLFLFVPLFYFRRRQNGKHSRAWIHRSTCINQRECPENYKPFPRKCVVSVIYILRRTRRNIYIYREREEGDCTAGKLPQSVIFIGRRRKRRRVAEDGDDDDRSLTNRASERCSLLAVIIRRSESYFYVRKKRERSRKCSKSERRLSVCNCWRHTKQIDKSWYSAMILRVGILLS